MRRAVCTTVAAVFVATQLGACATTDGMSGTMKGAGIGAAAGGLLGAVAGGKDRVQGAIIGAAAGAIIGAVIGHYYDRQIATRADAEKKYGPQVAGQRLEIEGSSLTPQDVKRGSTLDSAVQYTALAAQPAVPVSVIETRTLVGPKETIELAKREVTRAQGTHTSTMRFTFPGDLPRGNYTLVTAVSDGTQTRTVQDSVRVI
jgi:hypothetical protein